MVVLIPTLPSRPIEHTVSRILVWFLVSSFGALCYYTWSIDDNTNEYLNMLLKQKEEQKSAAAAAEEAKRQKQVLLDLEKTPEEVSSNKEQEVCVERDP